MFTAVKKLLTFSKIAIIWTAVYFVMLYALFQFMFRFDLLSVAHWTKLATIRLHGIEGLAFGVLILATLPVYFATLSFIRKHKKPPIPLPFCAEKKKEEKKDEAEQSDSEPAAEPEINLPAGLPPEMKEPYRRAMRDKANNPQPANAITTESKDASFHGDAQDAKNPESECAPISPGPFQVPDSALLPRNDTPSDSAFPIPDFDSMPEPEEKTPVFREINFGSTKNDDSKPWDDSIIDAIKSKGYTAEVDDGIIIAKRDSSALAICIHSDSDFWIADDPSPQSGGETGNWFAAGKQKTSPVAACLSAAAKHDATPVLYLVEKNIMDLDGCKEKWCAAGVKVIEDLEDL